MYYLIFDQKERFRGYTKDEEQLENFRKQRENGRNKFMIKEVPNSFFDEKALRKLKKADIELEEYYGVYVFQDEYDDAYIETSRMFAEIYRTISDVTPKIDFLHMDEKEERVLKAFKKLMENTMESIELGICTRRREEFAEVFATKKIVSKVLGIEVEGRESLYGKGENFSYL